MLNTTQETTSAQKHPISDFLYDVVTLMHERCKGMEALRTYIQDAQHGGHTAFVELGQRMLQQDTDVVKELEQILARNVTPDQH